MRHLWWLPLAATACTSAETGRPFAPPSALDFGDLLGETSREASWIESPLVDGLGPSWQLRAQRLRSYLQPDRLVLVDRAEAHPSWSVTLRLTAWGAPDQLEPVGPGVTWADGNRFESRRVGVVEWVEAHDDGLEHGFTLAGGGPETELDLAVDGGFVLGARNHRGVRIRTAHSTVDWSDLVAWDADRRPVPATVERAGGDGIRVRLDTSAARWPVTVDPLLWTEEIVSAPSLGSSTGSTLSLDGDRLLVGAPDVEEAALFARDTDGGSTWGSLEWSASNGTATRFAQSVALSGLDLAVSNDASSGVAKISMYTFDSVAGDWALSASLGQNGASNSLGVPVALDGDLLFAGMPGYLTTGLVAFWRRDAANGTWLPLPGLTGSSGSLLGTSVGLDGNTAVAGAPGNGTVRVYAVAPSLTTETLQTLTSSAAGFGQSVSVSGDWIAVGAPGANQVLLYHDDNGVWTALPAISAPFVSQGNFGERVAISGTNLAVTDYPSAGVVRVHLFGLSGTRIWGYLDSIDVQPATSPAPVALSSDLLVVGVPSADTFDVWGLSANKVVQQSSPPIVGATGGDYGSAVAMDGDQAAIGDPEDDQNGPSSGRVQTFRRTDSGSWTLKDTFVGASGVAFGTSVALVNRSFLAVGAPDDNLGTTGLVRGAVYLYDYNGTGWTAGDILRPEHTTINGHERFGEALAAKQDRLLVGLPGGKSSGVELGWANLYTREAGVWTLLDSFGYGTLANDDMGKAVAILGPYYVVASQVADQPTGPLVNAGLVQFYSWNPTDGAVLEYSQYGLLAGDKLGQAIAVDGDVIAIDAFGVGGVGQVGLWRLGVAGVDWTPPLTKLATLSYQGSSATPTGFGGQLALDGDLLFIGSPQDSEVEVRQRDLGGADTWGKLTLLSDTLGLRYGSAVAADDGFLLVGEEDGGGLGAQGEAYFYSRTNDAIPPTARDDDFTSPAAIEDTPFNSAPRSVLDNDTDANSNPLTVTVTTPPHDGTVSITFGLVSYQGNPDYCGPDAFQYSISDGTGTPPSSAWVSLNVTCQNDAPRNVLDQEYTFEHGTPKTGNLLDGVVDPDGDAMTVSVAVVSPTLPGTLVWASDGTYTFPASAADGDYTYQYTVSDGHPGGSVAAYLTFHAQHLAPTFPHPDQFPVELELDEDGVGWLPAPGLLDPNLVFSPYPLTVVEETPVQHGTLVFDPYSGEVHYYPESNSDLADTWVFSYDDGTVSTANVTLSITVNPVLDPPVARPDAIAGTEDTPLLIPYALLLANDFDVDTPLDELSVSVDTTTPNHGTIGAAPGPNFLYTPDPNYFGADTVSYHVVDSTGIVGDRGEAVITISITPVNDPPLAVGQAYGYVSEPVFGQLQASDVEHDLLTYRVADPPTKGALTVDPSTGAFQYTPTAGASGPDQFTFYAVDTEDSNVAVVSFQVVAEDTSLPTTDTAPPACTPVTWYVDGDHDGFGTPTYFKTQCEQPEGYVDNSLDCDDSREDIYAGAPEIVSDGVDQDCDGIDNQANPVGACSTGGGAPGIAGIVASLLLARRRGGAA